MTPTEAPETDKTATGTLPPAVSACPPLPLETLRRRSDFLRAARATRQALPGFVLQARQRGAEEPPAPLIRIGFTASKKVGNAVIRNRVKRRLRALARDTLPYLGAPGWDYVLIARKRETANRAYANLVCDLKSALATLHPPRSQTPQTPQTTQTHPGGSGL